MAVLSTLAARQRHFAQDAPICSLICYTFITFIVLLFIMAGIMYSLENGPELEALQLGSDAWLAEREDRLLKAAGLHAALSDNPEAQANLTALLQRLEAVTGDQPDPSTQNWSFIGCIYYTFSVFAAIGYGTFTPQTAAGRAVTVTLGLVGLGALVSLLGALSMGLHTWCRGLAARYCSIVDAHGVRRGSRKAPILVLVAIIFLYWLFSGLAFDALSKIEGDNWGLGISFYYAAVTFATIGFGDYSLRWYGEWRYFEVIFLIIFSLFGLVIFIELANLIAHEVNFLTDAGNVLPTEAKKDATLTLATTEIDVDTHAVTVVSNTISNVVGVTRTAERSDDCIAEESAAKPQEELEEPGTT